MIFYLYLNRNQYYEYDGDIQTIPCTYRQNSKIYSFDLKIFQLEDDYYISLNDLYVHSFKGVTKLGTSIAS